MTIYVINVIYYSMIFFFLCGRNWLPWFSAPFTELCILPFSHFHHYLTVMVDITMLCNTIFFLLLLINTLTYTINHEQLEEMRILPYEITRVPLFRLTSLNVAEQTVHLVLFWNLSGDVKSFICIIRPGVINYQ